MPTTNGLEKLAQITRAARGDRSKLAFEELTGISFATIGRIEQGLLENPKTSILEKLVPFTPYDLDGLMAVIQDDSEFNKQRLIESLDNLLKDIRRIERSLMDVNKLQSDVLPDGSKLPFETYSKARELQEQLLNQAIAIKSHVVVAGKYEIKRPSGE